MERQFAALDSMQTALRRELPDLRIVTVLKSDSASRLTTMVGSHAIPVLLDSPQQAFEKMYGASKHRSFFLYDRAGCLLQGGVDASLEKRADYTRMLDQLQKTYLPGGTAAAPHE
jgi:hypothetical protein